jgi:hypothetical protein
MIYVGLWRSYLVMPWWMSKPNSFDIWPCSAGSGADAAQPSFYSCGHLPGARRMTRSSHHMMCVVWLTGPEIGWPTLWREHRISNDFKIPDLFMSFFMILSVICIPSYNTQHGKNDIMYLLGRYVITRYGTYDIRAIMAYLAYHGD